MADVDYMSNPAYNSPSRTALELPNVALDSTLSTTAYERVPGTPPSQGRLQPAYSRPPTLPAERKASSFACVSKANDSQAKWSLVLCVSFSVMMVLIVVLLFAVLVAVSFVIVRESTTVAEVELLQEKLEELENLVAEHSSESEGDQKLIGDHVIEVLGFVSPLGTFYNPISSCSEAPTQESGYYFIMNGDKSTPVELFCEFNSSCSCNEGGWTRVANFDLTNPEDNCPQELQESTRTKPPYRACVRSMYPSCTSVSFKTHSIEYTRVCGRIKAYQQGTTDAFSIRADGPFRADIEDNYVDGISLTHSTPRQHIWTFAAGRDETIQSCPCNGLDVRYSDAMPPSVGSNFFCETGSRGLFEFRVFAEDPLWDGMGCGGNSTCCTFNNPPFFCTRLAQPTTSDVEMRVCTDDSSGDEDVLLELVELYIQ